MTKPAFSSPDVEAAFQAFKPKQRAPLLALRTLIYEAARETPTIGPLSETLKWGEPSYTPAKPKIGSSIRLGISKAANQCALFFICNTNLVDHFRSIYKDDLRFEGNRAIIVGDAIVGDAIAGENGAQLRDPLKQCVTMALTYHLNKR